MSSYIDTNALTGQKRRGGNRTEQHCNTRSVTEREKGTEQNMSDTEKEKSAKRLASTDCQERTEEHDRVKSSAIDS